MTREAESAISWADVVVGYKTYVGLIPPDLLKDKQVLSTGMRGEIERCEAAIHEALNGKRTVVVCSGDPGIYAMAGLLFELVETKGIEDRIQIEVVPGVPALCAASAILGAPLMHDFAVISLSDLMTPWELIKNRVRAALEADFVIVLYNPRSKKRTAQLHEVMELVQEKRGKNTPVGIVKNATRQDEVSIVTTAQSLDEQMVDMLTILVVGNSSTRIRGNRMVTPRGYMEKYMA